VNLQRTTSYEAMLGMIFTPAGTVVKEPQKPEFRVLRLGTKGFVSK
jgi:hypothetical protein